LKKSGDSFLQDASCFEVAPKLNKCRECRWSQAQRQKTMANIFCRFYAFRRLRYTKNGQIAQAGFCDPIQDAQTEDLKLWLPNQENSPKHMDKESAKIILQYLGQQFQNIYKQEEEAESYAEERDPAWKRVVQGVREMCDVCEATLFNKHWACGKCGFVVCIDCYKARVNGQPCQVPAIIETENDPSLKDKDEFLWLFCNNNKSHQLDSLMLTQIIAGDALEDVNGKLKVLSRKLWGKITKPNLINGWDSNSDKNKIILTRTNGIKDETDIKDEKDDDEDEDSSTLRDLINPNQQSGKDGFGRFSNEMSAKRMNSAETQVKFDAKHQWLCDGYVLRLEDAEDINNVSLFKFIWRRCQPVIVSGVLEKMDKKLWHHAHLQELPDQIYSSVNAEASTITHGQSIKKFVEGFDDISKRPQNDNGDTLALRFRENWPTQEDHFGELFPNQFKDLMKNLPISAYTEREGVLNLASRLPECFVRLDLGPRLWGGYAKSTYNLQYNVSDAIHILTHTSVNRDLKGDLLETLKTMGCDELSLEIAKDNPGKVGAVWHVFHPSDADRIKEFLNKNLKQLDPKNKPRDLLLENSVYLKERLMSKMSNELGIKPWTIVQMFGDGVLIPAGAPYQIKVLNASLFCQSEFVSPEHIDISVRRSIADIQQFDDRLQIKNLVFHSCKDAISVLDEEDEEDSK